MRVRNCFHLPQNGYIARRRRFAFAWITVKSPFLLMVTLATWVSVSAAFGQQARESADPYFVPNRSVSKAPGPTARQSEPTTGISNLDKPLDSSSNTGTIGIGQPNGQRVSTEPQPAPAIAGATFEQSRILAKVGGQPIFFSDLAIEASQLIEQFIPTAPQKIKNEEKRKLIPRLLPKYIETKLLFIDVKDGLPDAANLGEILESVGEQFDEKVLPKLMESSKVKSPAMLDAQFRAQGSSLRTFRMHWCESEFVKYVLRDKINVDSEISHREMYERYVDDRDKYVVKAKVRWEQLMVRFDQFPSREAARVAIAEMGNEVVYGASLAAVAKEKSHGFHAEKGGQQGWTTRGSLVNKELDELLFSMELDKLSDIIELERGFSIVRVLERTQDGFVPFAEAQGEIRKQILESKRQAAFKKYVDGIRARIPVEIYEPTHTASQPQKQLK